MFVSKNVKICVSPNANPQCVEYSSRWVSIKDRDRVGHVDFMLFTSYSLELGTQREPSFQWNTGLKPIFHCDAKLLRWGQCELSRWGCECVCCVKALCIAIAVD